LTTIVKPKIWNDSPLLFREKQPERSGQTNTDPVDEPDSDREKAVLCRSCKAAVTGLNRQVFIHGKYLHTFFNPAGIVYEIRCFSQAPGCIKHGLPTDEFTWFAGYTWEYTVCANCLDHLGWFYSSSSGSFFGLINSKLIVE
jgi:hypothetical protein